jgi:small subunit ribosomal protein S8
MVSDPIADFIIRLKNASAAGRASVSVPYSNIVFELANVFEREGYVASVAKRGKKAKKSIEVGICYEDGRPRITDARRISKPSRRVYRAARDLMPVRQGHGLLVVSTPKGLFSGAKARKQNIGGEALCEIW